MDDVCIDVFAGEKQGEVRSRPDSMNSDEGESNIVDKLLGDIRSGFTNNRNLGLEMGNGGAHVGKVELGNGDVFANAICSGSGDVKSMDMTDGAGEFSRSGSLRGSKRGNNVASRLRSIEESGRLTPDSEGRLRRSAEIQGTEDLFDYLQHNSDDSGKFDRQGSLRRSRQNRQKRNNIDNLVIDRERAASPAPSTASDGTPTDVKAERKWSRTDRGDNETKNVTSRFLERSASISSISPSRNGRPGAHSPVSAPVTAAPEIPTYPLRTPEHVPSRSLPTSNGAVVPSTSTSPETTYATIQKEREQMRKEKRRRSSTERIDMPLAVYRAESRDTPKDSEVPETKYDAIKKGREAMRMERRRRSMVERTGLSFTNGTSNGTESDLSPLRNRNFDHYKSSHDANSPEVSMTPNGDIENGDSKKSASEEFMERHNARYVRRHQSNVEPSAIESVRQKFEGNGKPSYDMVDTPRASHSTNDLTSFRLRSVSNKIDVDEVIKEVQKTGDEIQMIGKSALLSPRTRSRYNRPWANGTDSTDVEAVLNAVNKGKQTEDPVSPHVSASEKWFANDSSKSALRQRLDNETETITEKAWLKHESGRWKSDINKEDVEEAVKIRQSEMSASPRQRPYSTYDNVKGTENMLQAAPRRERSSGDVSDSPTKRWGRVFEESKEADTTTSPLKRSATLPRKWKHQNKFESMAPPLEEESKQEKNNNTTPIVETPKLDHDSNTLERGRLRRSFRDSPVVTSTMRNAVESRQLENNVHNFQSTTAGLSSGSKNKLKALSKLYSNPEEEDPWTPSPVAEEPTLVNQGKPQAFEQTISPRSSRFSGEFASNKSDTDSLSSSNRDEGFESETVSDPSVSQRTSMSSTLESELCNPGTPNLGRKDYDYAKSDTEDFDDFKHRDSLYSKDDLEDSDEPNNHFARSIDSLVHRPELSLTSELIVDDDISAGSSSEKTPTIEDRSLEIWRSTPTSDCDVTLSNTPEEEEWRTETYTTETPISISDLPEKVQRQLLHDPVTTAPAPPKRTTSRLTNTQTKSPAAAASRRTPTKTSSASSSPVKSVESARTRRPVMSRTPGSCASLASSGTSTPTKTRSTNPTVDAVTARLTRPRKSTVTSPASDSSATRSTLRGSPLNKAGITSPSRNISSPTPASSSFVRGAPGRATMPASVLRTNKKAARDAKDVPVPPRRTSSIRATERLNMGRKTSIETPPVTSPGTTTTTQKPKRTTPSSTSKSEGRLSQLVNRLSTPKGKSIEDITAAPSTPKSTRKVSPVKSTVSPRPRTSDIWIKNKTPSSPSRLSDDKKEKSGLLNKIIPNRKSTAGKVESPTSSSRAKVNLKTTLKSSRC